MTITVTLIQTRPNIDVDFHSASDDFKALKTEMVAAGTLVDNGGSNSENGLIRTWTLTFSNDTAHSAYLNDSRNVSYIEDRQTYNGDNGISEQIS
tara:strand:+ start:185 stop:469 length:285 start_codon:yes stop_codon:yes gene_type:complete